MKTPFILLTVLAALARGQESKPPSPAKPEAPATAKPVEVTVLGRKVPLAIPADWAETATSSTIARGEWKHAKGWEHSRTKGLSIRVYASEGKDLTPSALAQKWMDSAGKGKPELIVSVTGKNRTLKGLDTEVEMCDGDAYSFYWMRAIAIPPKDKVLIVLAEASPLDHAKLGSIMDELRPILDSVLDPSGKDPWRRDPNVTVTAGELVTRLTVPAAWAYGRHAPEGSLTWTGSEGGQHIELEFPLRSVRLQEKQALMNMAAPMVYKVILEADETMIEQTSGKTLSKTTVPGHDQATDRVMVTDIPGTGPVWIRRRLLLDGTHLTSLQARQSLPDVASLPPETVQKQVAAFMDSFKVEIVRR